jgi:DNA-directed RNA polymerase alpha subunit
MGNFESYHDCVIFPKSNGHHVVKDSSGSFVNGIEREGILQDAGLAVLDSEESNVSVNISQCHQVPKVTQGGIPNCHIDYLGLNQREKNCLNQAGIRDLRTLVQMSDMELLKIPSLGKTSLRYLVETLNVHGLTLGMQIDAGPKFHHSRKRSPITAENLRLNDINLSVREWNCLKGSGINDLQQLVQKTGLDLLRIPSFGEASLSRLENTLRGLGLSLGMESSDVIWVEKARVTAENLSITDIDLSARESNCLQIEGILDLKELVQMTDADLLKIPRFGKRSLSGLQEILGSFGLYLGMDSSDVIWVSPNQYIETADLFVCLPKDFDVDKNFGVSIGEFIAQYAMTMHKKSHQLIFQRRISSRTKDIRTLEELGRDLGITRERVRQLERKIIRQLVDVIFRAFVLKGGLRIDNEFAKMWGRVAGNLSDISEISVTDFINELFTSWNVSFEDIDQYFNFICVVFTGKVKSGLVYKLSDGHPLVASVREKFNSTGDHRLSDFRIGGTAQRFLAKRDIFSINDLLYFLDSEDRVSNTSQSILENLMLVTLDVNGDIGWLDYLLKRGFEPIERRPLDTHQIFMQELCNIMADALRKIDVPRNSLQIFNLRTSKHPLNRPTFISLSDKLEGNYAQPAISRAQRIFLEKLHDIFVGKIYSEAWFSLSDNLVRYFDQSKEIYLLAENDFNKFIYLVKLRFGIKDLDLDSVSTLWTILDGYTPERYFHLTSEQVRKRKDKAKPKVLPTSIKLAGFRDIY